MEPNLDGYVYNVEVREDLPQHRNSSGNKAYNTSVSETTKAHDRSAPSQEAPMLPVVLWVFLELQIEKMDSRDEDAGGDFEVHDEKCGDVVPQCGYNDVRAVPAGIVSHAPGPTYLLAEHKLGVSEGHKSVGIGVLLTPPGRITQVGTSLL